MKKIFVLLTTLMIAVCALAACGGDEEECAHEKVIVNPAVPAITSTCVEKGQSGEKICTDCGAVVEANVEYEEYGAHPQASITPIAAKNATCTEAGNGPGYKCTLCEDAVVIPTPVAILPHTPVTYPDKLPTTTSEGHTGGTYCSVCFEMIEQPTTVPALSTTHAHEGSGYIVETVAYKAPTCAEPGCRTELICTVCRDDNNDSTDYIIMASSAIPATGCLAENQIVLAEGKAATCTEAGYTAKTQCTACQKITESTAIAADANNHPTASWYVLAAVAPECDQSADGTRTKTGKLAGIGCLACNGIVLAQADDTRYPDHTFTIKAAAVPPSCGTGTDNGTNGTTVLLQCTKCGFEEGGEEVPYEHDFDVLLDTAVAPGCETAGKEATEKCSVCGYEKAGAEIPATDHSWTEIAAETDTTTKKEKCENCGTEKGGEPKVSG